MADLLEKDGRSILDCILMGMHSHVELHVWDDFKKILADGIDAMKKGEDE
jgi:hypothetical protein